MTYFNRKLMKRDIPASATVEGALVIPVILYAVAAVMFLLQLISIRMHVNDALYNALRKFNTYSYTSQVMTGEIYKSTFFAIFVDVFLLIISIMTGYNNNIRIEFSY